MISLKISPSLFQEGVFSCPPADLLAQLCGNASLLYKEYSGGRVFFIWTKISRRSGSFGPAVQKCSFAVQGVQRQSHFFLLRRNLPPERIFGCISAEMLLRCTRSTASVWFVSSESKSPAGAELLIHMCKNLPSLYEQGCRGRCPHRPVGIVRLYGACTGCAEAKDHDNAPRQLFTK